MILHIWDITAMPVLYQPDRSETHAQTQCRLSAHPGEREEHGRGRCQGTCLISFCLFIYHLIFFFSNPNLASFHSHPIYLLFYHELTSSPFNTHHYIYISSKHLDPSFNNLFLSSSRDVCLPCCHQCRQTSPCCRESCFTVPGWPSRPQLSIWPNTSSFSWTPMPAHPLTPQRSCWR